MPRFLDRAKRKVNTARRRAARNLNESARESKTILGYKAKRKAANILDDRLKASGERKKGPMGKEQCGPEGCAPYEGSKGARVYGNGGRLGDKVKRARLKAATKLREKGKEKAANVMNPFVTPKGQTKKKYQKTHITNPRFEEGGSLPIPGRRAAAKVLRSVADKKVKRAIKLKGKGKDVRAAGKMSRAKQLRSTASNLERKARQSAPRRRRLLGRR